MKDVILIDSIIAHLMADSSSRSLRSTHLMMDFTRSRLWQHFPFSRVTLLAAVQGLAGVFELMFGMMTEQWAAGTPWLLDPWTNRECTGPGSAVTNYPVCRWNLAFVLPVSPIFDRYSATAGASATRFSGLGLVARASGAKAPIDGSYFQLSRNQNWKSWSNHSY